MDERRSLWIPWALCGIFAVFLIANGVMLYFATRSWTGLATDNAYENSLPGEACTISITWPRAQWHNKLLSSPSLLHSQRKVAQQPGGYFRPQRCVLRPRHFRRSGIQHWVAVRFSFRRRCQICG